MDEFSPYLQRRGWKKGIDIEDSYRQMVLEIKVGGPVGRRLEAEMRGVSRHNQRGDHEPVSKYASMFPPTARELEVLTLYAAGLNAKAIGRKLFITHQTVDDHRKSTMAKLGVRSITHAVAVAIRSGMIQPPPRKSA